MTYNNLEEFLANIPLNSVRELTVSSSTMTGLMTDHSKTNLSPELVNEIVYHSLNGQQIKIKLEKTNE